MSPAAIILFSLAVLSASLNALLRRKGGPTPRERLLMRVFFWMAIGLVVFAIVVEVMSDK
jgi:hypothetical protein